MMQDHKIIKSNAVVEAGAEAWQRLGGVQGHRFQPRQLLYIQTAIRDRWGNRPSRDLTEEAELQESHGSKDRAGVVDFALEQPVYGQVRLSNELTKRGMSISPAGVRTRCES